MSTPFEFRNSQIIGSVESVSPREIKVALSGDAPSATSLDAGLVQRFPRINSWVLVPSETGYLVGVVTWLGIDTSAAVAPESHDQALLDIPFPRRRMSVTPLGTLRWGPTHDAPPKLVRGVVSYPSVGEPVLVPDAEQIRAIDSAGSTGGKVTLGTSPLAGDTSVSFDPDRLFGRHLAILGSTGSGKSCTVAGLVRWSLVAARKASSDNRSRARFVVLEG